MNSVWRSCLLVIPCSLIIALSSLAGPSFSQGIKHFQDNQLEQARDEFQLELKTSPNDILTIYNLGLVEYKLGKKGLGLAYWRRALALDPGNSKALSAIQFATEELLANRPMPNKTFYELIREKALVHLSFAPALLFAILFLFATMWVLLTHLGSRRRALLVASAPTNYPLYGYMLWVFSALFIGTAALKNIDRQIKRATVISGPAIVRSAPNEEATNLFELFEGSEVIVRQSKDIWTQVTLPGKSSGWIVNAQLFIIN